MKFKLEKNDKFACIAFNNISRDESFDELDLGGGLWVTSKIPFELDDTWRTWMGSLKSEAFAKSNFVIIAKKQSSKPEILDEEHKELGDCVYGVFLMLLMYGIPHYDGAFDAKGSMMEGRISTREFGPVDVHYRPADVLPKKVTKEAIKSATKLEVKLRSIYAAKGKHMRFKRGFYAWRRGILERQGDNMLHQCVRAVEALIRPPIGGTTRKFIHRSQTFATRSQASAELLEEIYELRCRTEHMNDWDDVLAKYNSADRTKIAKLRSYEAFLLACYAYRRILGNDAIFDYFSSDTRIDEFWAKPDDERDKIWGAKIDVDTDARQNFR